MLSQRPWMDRIVRESEFVAPGLFREYYEHLARGYARGVRQAQLSGEVDARYDPEVIAFIYTGIGNFVGMRWADWTAGGQVPDDVLDDLLEVLRRGPAARPGPRGSRGRRSPVVVRVEDAPDGAGCRVSPAAVPGPGRASPRARSTVRSRLRTSMGLVR